MLDLQGNLETLDPLDHRVPHVCVPSEYYMNFNHFQKLNKLMCVSLCVLCMCFDMTTQLIVTSRKENLAHLDLLGYMGKWDRKVTMTTIPID